MTGTALRSVIVFQHKVNAVQWSGVGLVFVGLGLDAVMSYYNKHVAASVSAAKKAD